MLKQEIIEMWQLINQRLEMCLNKVIFHQNSHLLGQKWKFYQNMKEISDKTF